jgi:hypothetical protein
MDDVRAPCYPQTQGKRTLASEDGEPSLGENFYLRGELKAASAGSLITPTAKATKRA